MRKQYRGLFVVLAVVALLASPLLAQNAREDTNFTARNTKLCFEATLNSGPDVCLKRTAAGIISLERADGTSATLQIAGSGGNTYALGAYQGTTSVGITDTAFHPLAAAASDIAIPANRIIAGKRIRIHASGVYTTAAASLLNGEVMLCQVSGCASGTVVAPAGCAVVTTNQANVLANGQFTIDCTFTATSTVGASGTFMAKSTVCANLGAAVTAVVSCFADQATAVSAAVDETVSEFVNIGFKFSTSNAGNSAIVHEYSVEVLN